VNGSWNTAAAMPTVTGFWGQHFTQDAAQHWLGAATVTPVHMMPPPIYMDDSTDGSHSGIKPGVPNLVLARYPSVNSS